MKDVEMPDVKIIAIVGSLRKRSVNAAVARAAVAAAPAGVDVELVGLADVPLYHGDVEAAGVPAAVQILLDKVASADGLLIFSPEYNVSFPAVTKNAIDWLTRPPKAWAGSALSLVVTTPGSRAGLGLRSHFEAIMAYQPVRVFESLGIGTYADKLGDDGEVTDPETLAAIADHVAGFAAFSAQELEPSE